MFDKIIRMKTKSILIIAGAILIAGINAFSDVLPSLIPMPQKTVFGQGRFSRTGRMKVGFAPDAPGAREAAVLFANIFGGRVEPDSGNLAVSFVKALAPCRKEGYILSVTPDKVKVQASDAAGFFYAVQTLRQLSPEPCAKGKLPDAFQTVEITDWPRYQWRGILLDECRHFFGMEEVKKLLDQLAFYKMNVFHWHLTDDQGWRIQIDAYPELTTLGSVRPSTWKRGGKNSGSDGKKYGPYFYTKAQIWEILDYAKKRHITVMPEIEIPGHSYAVVSVYPELYCKDQAPIKGRSAASRVGVLREVVCPSNPKAIEFFEKVLDEVCELSPSEFIHIGGDEAPRKNWKTCSRCQAMMKKKGFKEEFQLQSALTAHLTKYLAAKGRRAIGWDEILEGGIPKNTAVMSWRGSKGGIKAAKAGHDVVMTPNTFCYFDYTYKRLPFKKAYAFDPCRGIPAVNRSHVLGGQCNNWTEWSPSGKVLEPKMFPRTFATAEALWTASENRDFNEFVKRAKVHCAIAEKAGVGVTPIK